jgi:hypothetical protein
MWQALIAPIAGYFSKRVERSAAKDSLKSKATLAQIDTATQITLTDAEWEIAKAQSESGSWKDEWITLVMTAPITLIIIGSVVAGFGYGSEMVDGAVVGITTLNEVGIPMGELMTATVFAGLGLKLWRGK